MSHPMIDESRLVSQIAVFLRMMRKHAGLTQAQLAQWGGMKQSAIARLESGQAKSVPSLSTIARIAAVCGVPLRLASDLRGQNPESMGLLTLDVPCEDLEMAASSKPFVG